MSGVADSTSTPALDGSRRSRLLGRMRPSGVLVAVVSTIVVFGALGCVVVSAPGWSRVQEAFFNSEVFTASFPDIVRALRVNFENCIVAEILILLCALCLAVMRSLPGPVFFPIRLMAVLYIDFFRGVPGILVIFLLALGVPGLRLEGVTIDAFIWGVVALVLVWSAYVAEV